MVHTVGILPLLCKLSNFSVNERKDVHNVSKALNVCSISFERHIFITIALVKGI